MLLVFCRLISVGENCARVKLITMLERGRIYKHLKFSEKYQEWYTSCEMLNICPRTANRYIMFYDVCAAFPRIIVTGLSFEEILSNYGEIVKVVHTDSNLKARLALPLKTTTIKCGMTIDGADLPSGSTPPEDVERFNWGCSWATEDICEQQMTAEEGKNFGV